MSNKKVLIISSEALSKSSSNGRTMMNMLNSIQAENLAQFYIHGTPDQSICSSYFGVSDNDALRAFLGKEKIPKAENKTFDDKPKAEHKPQKSYRNLVLRNIVWQSMLWWKSDFDEFLLNFNPNIILLQAGDAPFMFAITLKIAKKFNAKLMMFNTESYVLKKVMYASVDKSVFWHGILMSSLKKQYKRFMDKADFCIYSLEALEAAYQEKYPHKGKSCTLYTVSELGALPDCSGEPFSLLYCGNLGVGRDVPIDELAKALYDVDKNAKLDIYGKFISDESQKTVCANPNVCYHGFVDYSEIPNLMSRASMLVHCENNGRLENLRYAFSTKIADSISGNRPFLVYASREYPFVKYLSDNQSAHIASDYDELKTVLKRCIGDKQYLYKYISNAMALSAQNHNSDVNCRKFEAIIDKLSN